ICRTIVAGRGARSRVSARWHSRGRDGRVALLNGTANVNEWACDCTEFPTSRPLASLNDSVLRRNKFSHPVIRGIDLACEMRPVSERNFRKISHMKVSRDDDANASVLSDFSTRGHTRRPTFSKSPPRPLAGPYARRGFLLVVRPLDAD